MPGVANSSLASSAAANDQPNIAKNSSSMHPSRPTNSPQGKPPESEQNEMRQLIEQAVSASIMEIMQLRRTLWLVLKQTGPITINEADTHPLWRMKATKPEPGKVTLEATQLPEPTPEQISEVVDILHGTMTPLPEAMDKAGLTDHPPVYIHMLITPKLVLADNGYWVDAALAKIAMSEPGQTN